MLMTPSGFGAVLFGWFTAEIGRQPYVVYGHLRTADAVSPVTTGAVATSLVAFVVVYAIVFGFGSYYLAKLLRKGPEPIEDAARGPDFDDRLDRKPKRPLSMPDENLEGRPGPEDRSRPSEEATMLDFIASFAPEGACTAPPSGCRSSGRRSWRSRSPCTWSRTASTSASASCSTRPGRRTGATA